MSHDSILLTPGPLTTSLRTKLAMLRDWGSWDVEFNNVTASVCRSLLKVVRGEGTPVVVPLQGSGTFSVEAAVDIGADQRTHSGARQRRLLQARSKTLNTHGTALYLVAVRR